MVVFLEAVQLNNQWMWEYCQNAEEVGFILLEYCSEGRIIMAPNESTTELFTKKQATDWRECHTQWMMKAQTVP